MNMIFLLRSFKQEIRRWKLLWSDINPLPISLTAIMASDMYSHEAYPNISTIFHILSVTPVTSAGVERVNSALKLIKNDRRSSIGQERLNALLMLLCTQRY